MIDEGLSVKIVEELLANLNNKENPSFYTGITRSDI